jgi:hypothetical protein
VTRGAALVLSMAVIAAGAGAYACGDARSHPYAGRLYRGDRDCVDPSSVIDVVDGPSGATCAPVCVASPVSPDGGRAIYVSTMCAPYPPFFDSSGNVPGCERALAASSRNDTCTGDAGSTNPAPRDASSDAPSE